MKEWLTAREIAAEHLPELPTTKSAVIRLAQQAGWADRPELVRRRAGRGGGTEYNIALLPTLAQLDYKTRHFNVIEWMEENTIPADDQDAPLSDRASLERDARLAIVRLFNRFSDGLQISRSQLLRMFTDKYTAGTLAVDGWIREAVPGFTVRTLQRWIAAERNGRTNRLAVDRSSARKGTGILDVANGGKVKDFILALIAHQPHLSAKHVRTLCRDEFGDRIEGRKGPVNMPPVRTFQQFLKGLKEANKVVLTKLTNPDHYRSTMAPSGTGTLRHIREANALWQIDASPVDALCVDGRHSLYACTDIATRRTIITLSKTPRASAVALMIRKAILAWGVPAAIKTDNGSDFVAKDIKRLFASLAIDMQISDAYQPQQKGHVERMIGTFQRDVGPLLPGFVGHSVADRKAIESRKSFAARLGESDADTFGVALSADDLQGKIDDWLALAYQHAVHGGLNGRTPFQAAADCTAPVRTVDERALDLLLMPAAGSDGHRVVTKFGIRIDHRHYMAPDLLPGTPVFVRQDTADKGRVFAFDARTGAYLATAICAELSGIHPETFVAAAKELHREKLNDAARQVKADMRAIAKGPALIDRVLDVARRDVPNVVALPKRSEDVTTPQIAAALDAANGDAPKRSNISASAEALHAQLQAGEPAPANVTPLPETDAQRYRRARDLMARIEAGATVDPTDALWLGGYRESAEYRRQKTMEESFGDQAPVSRS